MIKLSMQTLIAAHDVNDVIDHIQSKFNVKVDDITRQPSGHIYFGFNPTPDTSAMCWYSASNNKFTITVSYNNSTQWPRPTVIKKTTTTADLPSIDELVTKVLNSLAHMLKAISDTSGTTPRKFKNGIDHDQAT